MRKPARKASSQSVLPFAHVEAATRWAKEVVAGKALACKWVKLACQRHLDDLKRKDWPYTFDRNRAEDACVWMELFPHVKGQWAARREDIHLEPWQCFIACSLFGWVNKRTKLRRFREAYVEISRKNGKSVLAALVGLRFFAAEGDFGAEVYSGATSEKQALAYFLDSRVSVVVGTHTHAPTADERILPGGTACLTDAGMTGPHDGVIGMDKDAVIARFVTGLPGRFETASGNNRLNGVVVTIDEVSARATDIHRISLSEEQLKHITESATAEARA